VRVEVEPQRVVAAFDDPVAERAPRVQRTVEAHVARFVVPPLIELREQHRRRSCAMQVERPEALPAFEVRGVQGLPTDQHSDAAPTELVAVEA
jgi:hypothetical protein